jgi:signal transduction histidine kinase
VDLAIAFGVIVLNVGGTLLEDTASARQYADPVMPVLLLLSALPGAALALRRRRSVIVLAVVGAVVAALFWLDWPEGNIPAALLIATYSVGAWASPRRGAVAMAAMFMTMGVLSTVGPPSMAFDRMLLLIFTPPWLIGVVMRWRRVQDAAAVHAWERAEAEHAAGIERRLQEERLAVARDLHDGVSHHLAGIVLQAASARRRAGGSDERVLGLIEDAGRQALVGLYDMASTLESRADRAPAPQVPALIELVTRYSRVHGPVDLVVDPGVADVPESTRVTTFRMVQEALTNVAKHAAGSEVSVAVRSHDDRVTVVVRNGPGRRPPEASGSGVGLAGLRERVALFGGHLEADVTDDDGFEVRARLPRASTVGATA